MAQQVIIAFDTSSSTCSVALLKVNAEGQEQVFSLNKISPMQQGSLILPMIQELVLSAKVTVDEITAVIYGSGPGSFTGLRLASSVAQALGFTRKIPIIAISSMAVLAQTVFMERKWPSILVALDARKGNLFFGAYKANHSGLMEAIQAEQLCAPEEISIGEESWYGAGDGWKYLAFKPIELSSSPPNAIAMLELAKNKIHNQNAWLAPSDAIPVYLSPYKS